MASLVAHRQKIHYCLLSLNEILLNRPMCEESLAFFIFSTRLSQTCIIYLFLQAQYLAITPFLQIDIFCHSNYTFLSDFVLTLILAYYYFIEFRGDMARFPNYVSIDPTTC